MHVVNNICSVVCLQAYRLDTEKLGFHEAMMGRILERELRIAIHEGVTQFRVGMNMGADIWAARRLIWLRDTVFPQIRLHCYLPCETQANHWPELWREPYFDVLARADKVFTLQGRYTRGCLGRRSQEMLKGSGRLLAVHDNVAEGFLDQAISYAETKGIETIVLRPLEGPDVPTRLGDQSRSGLQVSSAYSEGFSNGRSAIKRAW
ncbi:MAG: DUF1273 domain-containing protein [Oscillospiraceae bacterium]|nr:DUF1273 domain-containing protein [Oscillospiraceae bacterium]